MHALNMIPSSDRLRQRRKSIETTLQHLQRERRQVEQNTQWMDRLACQDRLSLLDRLTRWYQQEMGQIDQALGGSSNITYGVCAACHEPIEADRLDFDPHAEFCAECEEYRETLRAERAKVETL
jgi:RNA polymerase-binding transcription factor DksA